MLQTLKLTGSPRDYRVVWAWTALIAAVQTCWALLFIYKTSFVVEGRRYFCLFDDAMISMRYAANWADGYGLVWNPGERVEGYTNFLWTILMGFCHSLPLSRPHLCLLVQLMNIPILWACLAATVFLARASRCLVPSAIAAMILTAGFYNLAFYSLMGMETGFATALTTFGLAWVLRSYQTRAASWANALWFIPAVLARPDMLPLACLVLFWTLIVTRRGRLSLIAGSVLLMLAVAGHLCWRHSYYGEWVPNTYYLKMTNWPALNRFEAGLMSLGHQAGQFCVPGLLALMALLGFRRECLILAGTFALGLAYHVYVGGDAWEMSRFLIPAAPALFVLTGLGIRHMSTTFAPRYTGKAATGLLALCVISLNWWHAEYWSFQKSAITVNENRQNICYWRALERIAAPDASIAVGFAGTVPYFSGRRSFDVFGKCDPAIARMAALPGNNRPGHNKIDLAYTAETHRPDAILHAVDTRARPFTRSYRPVAVDVDGKTVGLAVRVDSPRIHGGRPIHWAALADLIEGE